MANYKKSPIVGGLLSFFFPGVGQLYNEEYGKGIILITTVIVSIGSIVYNGISLSNRFMIHHQVPTQAGPIVTIVISALVLVAVWLYGIIDAVVSAQRENVSGPGEIHAPVSTKKSREGMIGLGVILILFGLVGLLLQMGVRLEYIFQYGFPGLLITAGVFLLVRNTRSER